MENLRLKHENTRLNNENKQLKKDLIISNTKDCDMHEVI